MRPRLAKERKIPRHEFGQVKTLGFLSYFRSKETANNRNIRTHRKYRTPPSALGAYRPVSREEMMVLAEEEEQVPGYEPCILWEPPADKGSISIHLI